MKVQYWCSVEFGPEVLSKEFDTYDDFGLTDRDWEGMSDEEKEEGVQGWVMEKISYGIKEIK